MSGHSAESTYIGFAFQPLHALLTLLCSQHDESFVRIEAEDDVVLGAKGEVQELQQLKHIVKNLSHKSDDFWKTLKIWIDYIAENKEGSPLFVLISTSQVVTGDPIELLASKNKYSNDAIAQLDMVLEREAKRVCDTYDATKQKHPSKNTYEKRINACKAYLTTPPNERLFMLSRVSIIPAHTPIKEIDNKIESNLKIFPPIIRRNLSTRVIEWWTNVSLRSVIGERDRSIHKDELTRYLTRTASELMQNSLIDDMAYMNVPASPPADPIAQKQLELIDAQPHAILRSLRTHWLAREQRSKWVKDNPSNHGTINDFDLALEFEWEYFFQEVCSECLPDESAQKRAGIKVLDWSHREAHNQVRAIREGWSNPDLVRGTYQILASRLRVGWHPKFNELLRGVDDSDK